VEHIFPTSAVLLVGAVLLFLRIDRYDRREQRLLVLTLAGHVFAAFVQVWLTEDYYAGGDMLDYQRYGGEIARVLEIDFGTMAIENLKLVFQMTNALPVDTFPVGTSSGTMCAVAGFLLFFLGGSLYAACMTITVAAFFGNLALYDVFRDNFPEAMRRRLLIGTMLVPSVIFWSSGLLKESIAIGGTGWMLYAVHRALEGRVFRGSVIFLLGGVLVWITKPYVLFPFILAAAVWVYWEKSIRTSGAQRLVVRPLYFELAAAVAVGAIAILGAAFPMFAVDHIAEETANYQEIGQTVVGGSSYAMGDPTQRSIFGQLAFAPVALVSSLFRPFLFEVKNILMFISALEMTALLVVFVRTVWTRSWRATYEEIRESPLLMFSTVFTILFGVAVGLATTNLGTLARYRMPLLPFYVPLVLVLSAPRALAREDEEEDDEERAGAAELAG